VVRFKLNRDFTLSDEQQLIAGHGANPTYAPTRSAPYAAEWGSHRDDRRSIGGKLAETGFRPPRC